MRCLLANLSFMFPRHVFISIFNEDAHVSGRLKSHLNPTLTVGAISLKTSNLFLEGADSDEALGKVQ